jgi:hypothetical protein
MSRKKRDTMKIKTSILTGLFIMYSLLSFAQAGALDGDFDADGKVITTISGGNDFGNAVAM